MLKRAHQIDNVNLWDLLRVLCSLLNSLTYSHSLTLFDSNRYYRNIQNCLNDKQTSNSQARREGIHTAKRGFSVENLLQTFCRAIENFMLMLRSPPPSSFTSRRSHKSLVK